MEAPQSGRSGPEQGGSRGWGNKRISRRTALKASGTALATLGLAGMASALSSGAAAGGQVTGTPTTPSSRATEDNMVTKPTILLLHGAWADGSNWDGVVRRLQRDGYTVDSLPNPLRGVAGDSAYLASFLQTVPGPIVLVGHSYGGAVITNAATGNTQVKALVYVDAFIPDQGDTVLQLVGAVPGSHLGGDPTTVFNFVPYPGAAPGDADLYVKTSIYPDAFTNGLPPATGAVLAATQRPLTLSSFAEPSGVPAWKSIPSWCFVGTEDNVIPPAELLAMGQRANAHIVQVAAPHLSMIARPDDVTELIERAARAAE